MFLKIFLMLVFWSCILIMYIMYFNETEPKKNIILGATIPYDHLNDAKVKEVVADYKKYSTCAFVALTLVLIPCAFTSTSVNLFYSMTWLLIAIIVETLPYVHANKELRKFKKENRIHGTSDRVVDLKLSTVDIKTISPLLSLIPFAISLVPIIYLLIKGVSRASMLFPLVILSITILICMALHILVDKRKQDVVGDNTDINYSLSVIRSRNWAKAFIGLSALIAVMSILVFMNFTFDKFSGTFPFISIMILSIISIPYIMYLEFDTRKKQFKYTADNYAKGSIIIDEDDYWIWGLFYYNPKDNRVIIPDRVGSNTSVNIAKPAGKILMGISMVLIAAMPLLGGFFVVADEIPMNLEFTDTAIIATHLSEDYNIPRSEISEIVETKVEPKFTTKINGWSSDSVRKGTFRSKDYGVCEVFLPSTAKDFYIIKTKDGSTYIFGQ